MYDKLKRVKRLIFLLFCMLILLGTHNYVMAQSWLSPDWNYRKALTIDNSDNSSGLTDYQVKILLDSTNFDFSKAQIGGEDIRFTESDGITLIDYWIEDWNSTTDSALVWVKVPSVPASDSALIYMYYANPETSGFSSGPATFEFFDDFETDSLWETGWRIKEPLPLVKAYNAAAVYNDSLYVFGGYDRDTVTCIKYYSDETFVYDPATDSWTQLADMPTARWGATAVELGGLIHVFAGEVDTGGTATHEVYDPATDTWSIWSDIPSELAEQGITGVKYGDKIHLFCRSYHYEYDPAADTFIAKAAVPTSRTLSTCALVDSLIYVIGGYAYGSPAGATDVNEAYDPLTDTWTTKAPMPISRYGATRENPVIDGKIYVTHGLSTAFYSDNYVYDPSTDTWETRSSGINPRDGVGCGVIDDKLYVVGGRDRLSCAIGLDYVEEYDPTADGLGGSNPWVISNNTVIRRDSSARYEGAYGFFFDKQTPGGWESAEHYQDMATCALDLYWNITDYWGLASSQPQGAILLTGDVSDGTLLYYNYEGTPTFRWYNGSYTNLQAGMWNSWYPVTVIWNGLNSRVIIAGTEHEVSASSANSDRVYLRVNKQTRQYFDLIRVRKYSSPEPSVIIGSADSLNLFPHLTIQDTTTFLCEPETTCFSFVATDPNPGQLLTLEKVYGAGEFDSLAGFSPLNANHCFLPGSEDSSYLFVFRVTDSKGASDEDSSYVHIHLNQGPALTLPEEVDTLYKRCIPGDSIEFEVFALDNDSGDSLSLTKLSIEGELRPEDPISGIDSVRGVFIWYPDYPDTLSNPHLLIFKAADRCGHHQTDTLQVWIEFNRLPVLLSVDTSYALCEDSTVCFNHLLGVDADADDSLSLELIYGPACSLSTSPIDSSSLTALTAAVCFLTSGDSLYSFVFELSDKCGAFDIDTVKIEITPPLDLIIGDPNGDSNITVSDVIYIINYLFKGGPPLAVCFRSGDVNCDGQVSVSDVIYLINYLFKGGPPLGC